MGGIVHTTSDELWCEKQLGMVAYGTSSDVLLQQCIQLGLYSRCVFGVLAASVSAPSRESLCWARKLSLLHVGEGAWRMKGLAWNGCWTASDKLPRDIPLGDGSI